MPNRIWRYIGGTAGPQGDGWILLFDDSAIVPATGGTYTGNVTAPQFISNVATGTAPFGVTSTTAVTNLNADMVDGYHATSFVQKIGDTISGTLSFGSVIRQMINLYSTNYALGAQNNTTYARTGGNFAWYLNGSHATNAYDPGVGGTELMRLSDTEFKYKTNTVYHAGNLPAVLPLAGGTLTGGLRLDGYFADAGLGKFNLVLGPTDIANEGGQVVLEGHGTQIDWSLDAFNNTFRLMEKPDAGTGLIALQVDGGGTAGTPAAINVSSNKKMAFGAQTRQMIDLYNSDYGIGVQGGTLYFRTGGGFAFHKLGVHSNDGYTAGEGGTRLGYIDNNGAWVATGGVYGSNLHMHTANGWLYAWDSDYNQVESYRGMLTRQGWATYLDGGYNGVNLRTNGGGTTNVHLSSNGGTYIYGHAYLGGQTGGASWGATGMYVESTGYTIISTNQVGQERGLNVNHFGSANVNDQNFVSFRVNGGQVGFIDQAGTTSVAYGYGSDRRLKDEIAQPADFDPALVVKALRPKWFRWKESGEISYGMIAQETYEHWGQIVSVGESDENGDIPEGGKPWGIDYGKLTPLLLATVKQLIERIEILEGND